MIDAWKHGHLRRGYVGMQIYCRCSIVLQGLLKIIPIVIFWEENTYKFSNKYGRRLCSVYKGGGAQPPQVLSWGCSSPHSPPGSYVPARRETPLEPSKSSICLFIVVE